MSVKVPFETRILIQDREGYTNRLDTIQSILSYQAKDCAFISLPMTHDPVFGSHFGYDTRPNSNVNVCLRFPKTILEKSSENLYNNHLMVIGIFVNEKSRVDAIILKLIAQLEDNEEYKNGNIYITTDTNENDSVFHIYIIAENGCKEIPEVYLCA